MPKVPKELDDLLPSNAEREEIRYALTRSSFPCPDIDKEWGKISTKIDEDRNNENKRHSDDLMRSSSHSINVHTRISSGKDTTKQRNCIFKDRQS